MSTTKTIQQMVDALASIANEPDRTLQQRPVRFAKAKEAIQAGRVLLESIAKQEQGEPVAYTTGHCKEKAKPNGCQLHNLQCSYPACDRKAIAHPQQRKPLTDDEFTTAIEVEGIPVEDVELVWAIKDLVEAAHGIKE